jgi:aryl-alcohol dehydrogenase-like predicted oxidoreductase
MGWLKDRALSDTERLNKVKELHKLSQELDISLVSLALCWCLKNPTVTTVILGASKVAQLEENLKCTDSMPKLTTEVMAKIEAILQNKPVIQEF